MTHEFEVESELLKISQCHYTPCRVTVRYAKIAAMVPRVLIEFILRERIDRKIDFLWLLLGHNPLANPPPSQRFPALLPPSPPMVSAGLGDVPVLLAIYLVELNSARQALGSADHRRRRREVRWEALRRREPLRKFNQQKKAGARSNRREPGRIIKVNFKFFF